jgi:hypothetical protein
MTDDRPREILGSFIVHHPSFVTSPGDFLISEGAAIAGRGEITKF